MRLFKRIINKVPKPIMKNTWKRRFKAWRLRVDRRMQQRTTMVVVDQTQRTCPNCGEQYIGRVCPQCGQAGTWSRYTWRQAILNFLDIWGLGNRPIFRTVADLFFRPGYMIRDYLDGHRQFYFPPFKLVAVSVALIIFVGWITGGNNHTLLSELIDEIGLSDAKDWADVKAFSIDFFARYNLSDSLLTVATSGMWLMWSLSKNLLYELLFIGVILHICIWLAFIRVNRYNFVETYIFLTYILSQVLMCLIPFRLFSWLQGVVTSASAGTASSLLGAVCTGLSNVIDFTLWIYCIAVIVLVIMDFCQFFNLSWKSTLLHLVLTVFVAIALFTGIAAIVNSIVNKDYTIFGTWFYAITVVAVVAQGFFYAGKVIDQNKALVPNWVMTECKLSMLSLLIVPKVLNPPGDAFFPFMGNLLFFSLCAALAVFLSLSPITVYKKYSRKWLALLPMLVVFALLILIKKL